jgi:transposase
MYIMEEEKKKASGVACNNTGGRCNRRVNAGSTLSHHSSVPAPGMGREQSVDIRELKALEIAARSKLVFDGKAWSVPSQSSPSGSYRVLLTPTVSCTCEYFQLTNRPCKHIIAARLVRERDGIEDAPLIDTDSVPKKPTYPQVWPAYNAAQTHEKDHFQDLLADLCAAILEPPRKGGSKGGRPPASLRDALFICVFKVYSLFSARRFASDLREAHHRGHLTEELSCDIAWKYLRKPEVTPILHDLIVRSSLPLRSVDVDFAIDSSGFGTNKFERWFDEKYGVTRSKAEWVKVHLCCGVKTNVVTAVVIGDKNLGDCPQFPELTNKTAENFTIREMSADKAYLSADNLTMLDRRNIAGYIPFKSNSVLGSTPIWDRMFHYFNLHREEFLAHYHKRSNVESTFSAIKRKFGDAVRSRTDTSMTNEALAKIVCHNICCVIQEWYELGIAPTDLGMPARNKDESSGPVAILKFPG